jgi:hypothetical protein
VWAIIADIDMSWPQWWPHCSFAAPLSRTEAKSNSQEDILKATTAYLNFKASLGYTLTISIHPQRSSHLGKSTSTPAATCRAPAG